MVITYLCSISGVIKGEGGATFCGKQSQEILKIGWNLTLPITLGPLSDCDGFDYSQLSTAERQMCDNFIQPYGHSHRINSIFLFLF